MNTKLAVVAVIANLGLVCVCAYCWNREHAMRVDLQQELLRAQQNLREEQKHHANEPIVEPERAPVAPPTVRPEEMQVFQQEHLELLRYISPNHRLTLAAPLFPRKHLPLKTQRLEAKNKHCSSRSGFCWWHTECQLLVSARIVPRGAESLHCACGLRGYFIENSPAVYTVRCASCACSTRKCLLRKSESASNCGCPCASEKSRPWPSARSNRRLPLSGFASRPGPWAR